MSSFSQKPINAPEAPSWLKEAIGVYTNEKKDTKGPDNRTLERWYQKINDLIHRESEGDVDHTDELENLRDEIYAYLY